MQTELNAPGLPARRAAVATYIGRELGANPFRTFYDLGYTRLVPIIPPGAPIYERSTLNRALLKGTDPRGKAVGVRGRNGDWHGFDWLAHDCQPDDLDRWHAMGAGVGIKTGRQPDGTWLVGIDADTLNAEIACAIEKVVTDAFGTVPTRIGRAPKALYVVRLAAPGTTYNREEFDDGGDKPARVEMLSDGRQFVAAGVHPATRQPYSWPVRLAPFDELPIVDAAALS